MSRIGRFSLPALLLAALVSLAAIAWAQTPDAEEAVAPAAPETPDASQAGAGLPEVIRSGLFPITNVQVLKESIALGNPDLPLLMVALPTVPVPVILVVDARNGKDTWSLSKDPIIVVATSQGQQWMDEGILSGGPATGTFTAIATSQEIVMLVQQLFIKKTRFF